MWQDDDDDQHRIQSCLRRCHLLEGNVITFGLGRMTLQGKRKEREKENDLSFQGFFMNPDCRYVEQNSGKTEYSFTVSLDSCGTQFINDFEGEAGQAYLENVLVLQVRSSTC